MDLKLDGVTAAPPGGGAARDERVGRGVGVSEVFHGAAFSSGTEGRLPGPGPERSSYGSFAAFGDPDGNGFLLRQITDRLPGRV